MLPALQVRSGSRIVRRPLRSSSTVTAVDSLFPLVGGWLIVISSKLVDPPATWTTRAAFLRRVLETSKRQADAVAERLGRY